MKFSTIISAATLVAASQAITVSWDAGYDDASRSLTAVSCSDGSNGLITRYNWQTQGQIPRFPYVGGMEGIQWNSPQCGTCWQLTVNQRAITVLAIDHAAAGFNIGSEAMNALVPGGVEAGRVDAQAQRVHIGQCGILAKDVKNCDNPAFC